MERINGRVVPEGVDIDGDVTWSEHSPEPPQVVLLAIKEDESSPPQRERMGLAPIREGFFGGLWTHHLRLYSRSRLLDLVARAGLSVVSTRQHVHYCLPFTHNLVYGLGMRLVQSGALAGADRFCYDRARSRWNPLEMGRSVLRAIDRWNDPISDDGMSAVILSVRARRAGGSAG